MAFLPLAPIAAGLLGLTALVPAQPSASTFELSSHDSAGRVAAVSLACDPTGGSHPKSDAACASLARAGGDFAKLRPRKQACTLIYAPVDVTATGTWRGEPVTFSASYGNRCAADSMSDGVFGF
ncbi:SSI family serine proteinase inhibitor [Amycolatopsis sp. H20-H5]|uniref:SSI family serine proteinase inhibitor n=1 Tax=Amycolatopsis sp. H20-H5 TaxID=3046309 RepID=UPI002DBB807A|nr:SSI family serine proteinase inhibitor [Amycolatopsis sp. H20-H5]MEC3977227.1 SSI family serine proteinase inhibitor [Amycolatopsis sp. H20-H5]